jgi:hypothetical protein
MRIVAEVSVVRATPRLRNGEHITGKHSEP